MASSYQFRLLLQLRLDSLIIEKTVQPGRIGIRRLVVNRTDEILAHRILVVFRRRNKSEETLKLTCQ